MMGRLGCCIDVCARGSNTTVCRVVHVECDQPNFLGLGSAGGTEELVTTVEPWQTILGSIILKETQFM
jgi:hypothetical protein